jgi:hypothetical protein
MFSYRDPDIAIHVEHRRDTARGGRRSAGTFLLRNVAGDQHRHHRQHLFQ